VCVLRAVIVAIALVAMGCVRMWTPVDAVTRIADDRIRVAHPDGDDEELEHARSCGATLIGVPSSAAQSGSTCDCATSCRMFDITRTQISVLRTSRRPISDYAALAVSIVGTVVLLAVVGLAAAEGAGGAQ
jgi:hypothetical protein